MDTMYRLIAILSDGLVGLSSEYGRQLWACCKMRKQHKCQECERLFRAGSKMYRPVNNSGNRMERICEECIQFMMCDLDKPAHVCASNVCSTGIIPEKEG